MTTLIPMKIEVSIDWQKLTDVIITSFEGGSTYWLTAAYHPDDVDSSRYAGYGPWYARKGYWAAGHVTAFHENMDDEEPFVHSVGHEQLLTGLVNLARLRPDLLPFLLEEPPGSKLDLVADADQADSIVQIIVLGEIRYG